MAESAARTATASVAPAPRAGTRFLPFPLALAALVILPVFFSLRANMGEPDLWWHVRNAQHLLSTGHFPRTDTYSFTATGATCIPHEWLAEILYYLAFRADGLRGAFITALLIS